MKEYQKIETLWEFDQETKKFVNFIKNPIVEMLKDIEWVFTEKIDGMNFRIYWDGHKLSYAGRTDNAQFNKAQLEFITNSLVTDSLTILVEQLFMEKTCTIFGELYGAGVQKGGSYSSTLQFAVFDIMVDDVYVGYTKLLEIVSALGLQRVPTVLFGTLSEGVRYVKEHPHSQIGNAPLEGLVGKPRYPLYDTQGRRIVVKIKARDMPKEEK